LFCGKAGFSDIREEEGEDKEGKERNGDLGGFAQAFIGGIGYLYLSGRGGLGGTGKSKAGIGEEHALEGGKAFAWGDKVKEGKEGKEEGKGKEKEKGKEEVIGGYGKDAEAEESEDEEDKEDEEGGG
jgi:hypothetical protein